jgi:sporulation protein YlmC with PRC-barrel domain
MSDLQESTTVISAKDVDGVAVYNFAGERLGAIDDVMIDKKSGRVAYAVLSFGGFLGIGNDYYPLPWSLLEYDTAKGGYVVNLDRRQLEGAPAFPLGSNPSWGDRNYETGVHDFYGVEPYWDSPRSDR